ncbi:MAG: right-handed parallel beta-helix repeat-containing protein, partial [Candidatus Dormibacteria bacterium]
LMRSLLHSSYHITAPTILSLPNALPALVLPARPTPYTLADLVSAGVVVPWDRPGWYLLVDSVFVAPTATLEISGAGLGALLMGSSGAGFTWLATWGGTITISGAAANPLAVTGWDEANNRVALPGKSGRPYIRAIGGQLSIQYVRFSGLGFWSGPTGGVAWTGTSGVASTGEAIGSTFTGDTYGAFASDSYNVHYIDDLFESNQMDGLRLHRGADNSTATGSAAVRNGENGFVVSRADNDVLRGDVSENNGSDGFLLDGQPMNSGASPSGSRAVPSTGSVLVDSRSTDNGHYGIEVDGGAGTVVERNAVCGSSTAISLRLAAIGTAVVGNQVSCGRRVDLAIGPAVTDTTVSGNALNDSRIGLLIRNSPNMRLLDNHLDGLTVFGIALRGTSEGVTGSDNSISGDGFAPVESADGASSPSLTDTNLNGWKRRTTPSVIGYLRFHPLLTLWLLILLLVAVSVAVTRVRRRPRRPYAHVVPWQDSGQAAKVASARPPLALSGGAAAPALALEVAAETANGYHGASGADRIHSATRQPFADRPPIGEVIGEPAGGAIPRCESSTITVGVEVGHQTYPTAVVILESCRTESSSAQDLPEMLHHVRSVELVPARANFTTVLNRIGRAVEHAKVLGDSALVVDATGLNSSALDLLRWRTGMPVRAVVFQAGKLGETSQHKVHQLGKRDLTALLETVLASGRLEIVEASPLGQAIQHELSRLGVAGAGDPEVGDGKMGDGARPDLVMALCLALWWAERVGQGEALLDWWDSRGQSAPEKEQSQGQVAPRANSPVPSAEGIRAAQSVSSNG